MLCAHRQKKTQRRQPKILKISVTRQGTQTETIWNQCPLESKNGEGATLFESASLGGEGKERNGVTKKLNNTLTPHTSHTPYIGHYGMVCLLVCQSTHPYSHKHAFCIWLTLCQVVNGEIFLFSQKSEMCTSPNSFLSQLHNMKTT